MLRLSDSEERGKGEKSPAQVSHIDELGIQFSFSSPWALCDRRKNIVRNQIRLSRKI